MYLKRFSSVGVKVVPYEKRTLLRTGDWDKNNIRGWVICLKKFCLFKGDEIPVVDELSRKEISDTSKFSSRLKREDIIQMKEELRSICECMSDFASNTEHGQKLMMEEFERMIEQIKPIEATSSSHEVPISNIPVDNKCGPSVPRDLGKDLRVEDGACKNDSFIDRKAYLGKEFD